MLVSSRSMRKEVPILEFSSDLGQQIAQVPLERKSYNKSGICVQSIVSVLMVFRGIFTWKPTIVF